MYIIGVSELDNDVGAVLFKDGKILGALNEERLTRKKRQPGVPRLAIKYLLEKEKITMDDLDRLVLVKPKWKDEFSINYGSLINFSWLNLEDSNLKIRLLSILGYIFYMIPFFTFRNFLFSRQWESFIKENNFPQKKIIRVDHHRSHAACAYYSSGWSEGLYITLDGQGGGVTGTVSIGKEGNLQCIHRIKLPNSIGFFYAGATKALGFKIGRHEGKVTGLAAYGKPNKECVSFFRKIIKFKNSTLIAPDVIGSYPTLRKLLRTYGSKDFAASVQFVFEEVISDFVNYWVLKTGISKVGFSGGVFANVKLNQKIHELKSIKEIYIFPNMSDGGLAYGACLDQFPWRSRTFGSIYLGPEFSKEEIERSLIKNKLNYSKPDNAPEKIASLLQEKKVVARFGGKMEYGPRALGNRSILYRPDIPEVNEWLNAALNRTEFMPFAPVTMYEHACSCYLGIKGAERSAEYMTITFNCTDEMKNNSSAVVHLDGTARPQLIRRDVNSFYYDILYYFHKKTGIPSLVNTSFNMHEEPIVCNPDDAIRAFKLGKIDVLSIGPFLVYSS